jgi:hypothetical protein
MIPPGTAQRRQRVAWLLVRASLSSPPARRLTTALSIGLGALVLRLISGVGFANYDTLYALAWGGQIARGGSPAYDLPVAPTPHPLIEILGLVLSPFSPRAIEDVTVALGFLALSACGWAVYRLGELWFGRAAGALAALLLLTRVPILSYGVRAYVDVPYVLLVLSAVLFEARRPRAGAPVLALLALAGLLRPEAWVFSGLYWLYLLGGPSGVLGSARRSRSGNWPQSPFISEHSRGGRSHGGHSRRGGVGTPNRLPRARAHARGSLFGLTLLAASAPLIWLAGDLAVTGNALWSLTNTRATAELLNRRTGIGNVPVYIPKRIGEVLGAPTLAAALLGLIATLAWARSRALPGVLIAVIAVVVFALFASLGLPIDTRYAFLVSAILTVFAGAGVFGWLTLEAGDARRTAWMALGGLLAVAILAFAPSQYRTVHRELTGGPDNLARQEGIQNELLALVADHQINLRCGRVGVPNHAPVPLLALYLKTSPANIVDGERDRPISRGVYVDPANRKVEEEYILDKNDPHISVSVPAGFTPSGENRSWRIFSRCSA